MSTKGAPGPPFTCITLDMLNALLAEHEDVMNSVKLVDGTLQYVFKNVSSDPLQDSFIGETLFRVEDSSKAPSPFVLTSDGAIDTSTIRVVGVVGNSTNEPPPLHSEQAPGRTPPALRSTASTSTATAGARTMSSTPLTSTPSAPKTTRTLPRHALISLYIGRLTPFDPTPPPGLSSSAATMTPRLAAVMVACADSNSVAVWDPCAIAAAGATRVFKKDYTIVYKSVGKDGGFNQRSVTVPAFLSPLGILHRQGCDVGLRRGLPVSDVVRHAMRAPFIMGTQDQHKTAGGSVGTLSITCTHALRT